MKKIKSLFKSLSIFLLVLSLVFSASINIFALKSDSNERATVGNIANVDNNKQNKIKAEEDVGKILDRYTGYADRFEEKIKSQDSKDIEVIIRAMLSRYNVATKDERRKFNIYIEKSLKILKEKNNLPYVIELEREFKILSNQDKYKESEIFSINVKEHPELYENFSEEDIIDMKENIGMIVRFGEILDKYTGNKYNYKARVSSFYYRDIQDFVAVGLDIFDELTEEEKEIVDDYIYGAIGTLIYDYPNEYAAYLSRRYKYISGNKNTNPNGSLGQNSFYDMFNYHLQSKVWYIKEYYKSTIKNLRENYMR